MVKPGTSPLELQGLALEVAVDAGDLLQGFARRLAAGADLGIGTKSTPTDLVSDADRAAEQRIAGMIFARRPDDGLLGEEGGVARRGTSGLRWVVDPLDGTVNFLHGLASWAVSIAVEDDAGVVAGVVIQPTTGEVFRAARRHGTFLGEAAVSVTEVADLSEVLLGTGFAYDASVRADQGTEIAQLLPLVRDIRRAGSAALDLAWCAAGRLDGYLEFGLGPWDWSAGRLLVTEAGGWITPVDRFIAGEWRSGVVAGGDVAHDALRDWLEGREAIHRAEAGGDAGLRFP